MTRNNIIYDITIWYKDHLTNRLASCLSGEGNEQEDQGSRVDSRRDQENFLLLRCELHSGETLKFSNNLLQWSGYSSLQWWISIDCWWFNHSWNFSLSWRTRQRARFIISCWFSFSCNTVSSVLIWIKRRSRLCSWSPLATILFIKTNRKELIKLVDDQRVMSGEKS